MKKYRISFVYDPRMGVSIWEAETPEKAVENLLGFLNRTIYNVEEVDGADPVYEVDAMELLS